jgi:hypothetical protein
MRSGDLGGEIVGLEVFGEWWDDGEFRGRVWMGELSGTEGWTKELTGGD